MPHTDSGLRYIREFQALYYQNPDGLRFVREEPGLGWTKSLAEARGKFMDSRESLAKVEAWMNDPGIGMQDFVTPRGGFRSFNDFFTRELRPGARPISAPSDESVLVSPADCLVEKLPLELTTSAKIPTKGDERLRVDQLLGGSRFAERFIGGSVVRCILEPTSYHHFHSPVTGMMLESRENVAGTYFDERSYSAVERFHRGYYVIDTRDHGVVAMAAIGLATISSVEFETPFENVRRPRPVPVHKGEKLGHFAYGGSMIILLFEPGRLDYLSVRQGQRIGMLSDAP